MGGGVCRPHRPLFLAIVSNPSLISGHPSLCIATGLRGLDWRPVNDHSLDSVRKVDRCASIEAFETASYIDGGALRSYNVGQYFLIDSNCCC